MDALKRSPPLRIGRWTSLLLAVLISGIGSAGEASRLSLASAPLGFVHEVIGVRDGLPTAGILQVLQTRDGFLWFATFDGLARFDGIRFEIFDGARFPVLGSNRIVDLAEAADGSLWIRSEQGHLIRYFQGIFRACGPAGAGLSCALERTTAPLFTLLRTDGRGAVWTATSQGLFRLSLADPEPVPGFEPAGVVGTISGDGTGRLWIGTTKGLWSGRPGHFDLVTLPAGALAWGPPTVAQDEAGEIWVGTPLGVGRLRAGVWTRELPPGFVDRDARGHVWASIADPSGVARLFRLTRGVPALIAEQDGGDPRLLPGRQVTFGPGGETWVAWTGGLFRDGVPVMRLPNPKAGLTSLLFDREGSLWATTSLSGELHAFHPARATSFPFTPEVEEPSTHSLFEDRKGVIWAGSGPTVSRLVPGDDRFRLALHLSLPFTEVRSFLQERSGELLIGTSRGLFRFDGRAADRLTLPGGVQEVNAHALYEDTRGALWVGSENGLWRRAPEVEGGGWTEITARQGLPFPFVRAIRETFDGAIWLGTNGGGAIRYAGGRFTQIAVEKGLSSDLVRDLWPAPDGRLWIATENRGLNRLDLATVGRSRPRIDKVSGAQGLFADGIHKIVPDGYGGLWMSSNRGVFRTAWRDLSEVADGTRGRLDVVAFNERDGMANSEANGGNQDSGLRDRQGRIWFPTQGGPVRFDPRELLRRREPPQLQIEGLQVGGIELPVAGREISLQPDQRTFSVEFSAPSFLAPERQRFRYRLFPYEREWIDAGSRRQAFYTQVPSGRYRFEALAAGADGVWTPRPVALQVEVVPRFYETWAFRALLGVGLLAAILGLLAWLARRRLARQKKLERLVEERTATIASQAERLRELDGLRRDFFANVSHELRTPLTLLVGPLQDLLEGRFGALRDEQVKPVDMAERNARRLLGLVEQLLEVAKLDAGRLQLDWRYGNLVAFLRRRVEAFLSLAERRGIEITLSSVPDSILVWFDPGNVEKILANLISNALKFTPQGGAVQVAITEVQGEAGPDPRAVRPRVAGAASGEGWVEIAVLDDGPGIPEEELTRVFDRFHQVQATAHRWPGAGIGLALARQLAELHQGEIQAANAPGHGALFTVRLRLGSAHVPPERVAVGPVVEETRPLPVSLPQTLDEAEEDSEGAGDGVSRLDDPRTTILVVEDNADIRRYIRRHLEPHYRVVEAANGRDGLESAKRWIPDLVVSDVMMPEVGGEELFRQLRADPELAQVPVFLVTAKASPEDRLQGLRNGVDEYLVKPFDPRELKARIDNLLVSRRKLLQRAPAPPRSITISEAEVTPADEGFLKRVQATIEARLDDAELSVEALAGALGCDRSYLLRRLRALTGQAPSDLIRSLRLQRAEQLLREAAGSVSEIAYSVGFKSIAHFSNAFQAEVGERPSAYAARHRAARLEPSSPR